MQIDETHVTKTPNTHYLVYIFIDVDEGVDLYFIS